eukprot:scaffold1667_cov258-Pinguiococcus_pyrenoidosus.AAC.20
MPVLAGIALVLPSPASRHISPLTLQLAAKFRLPVLVPRLLGHRGVRLLFAPPVLLLLHSTSNQHAPQRIEVSCGGAPLAHGSAQLIDPPHSSPFPPGATQYRLDIKHARHRSPVLAASRPTRHRPDAVSVLLSHCRNAAKLRRASPPREHPRG